MKHLFLNNSFNEKFNELKAKLENEYVQDPERFIKKYLITGVAIGTTGAAAILFAKSIIKKDQMKYTADEVVDIKYEEVDPLDDLEDDIEEDFED